MRIVSLILFLVCPLIAQEVIAQSVPAQNVPAQNVQAQEQWLGYGAPVAGKAGYFETSVGYLYFNTLTPSSEKQVFMGVDSIEALRINAHWAASIDSSYLRANNVDSTGHGGNIWSTLAGPVFYPVVHPRSGFFVRGLVGISVMDSEVRVSPTYNFNGLVAHVSYLVGGGFDRDISLRLTLRLGADYQRTAFFNAENVVVPQNNVRLTTGIAYRFQPR
jgi:hypothetical protein